MSKKAKTTGSYLEKSGRFGFHAWNLDTAEKYQEFIAAIIKEGVELATKQYKCHAYLPIEWDETDGLHGPPVTDPDIVYVELPLGENEYEGPFWSFRLSALVDSIIELNEAGEGGPIGAEERARFIALRDHLRTLAERIDAALARK